MASITLRQLECFAIVARSQTLRDAAAQLHMTESALGAAITQLERALGEMLCVRRRSRGVSITAAGSMVAAHADRILTAVHQMEHELSGRSDKIVGSVRFGMSSLLARTLVPRLAAALSEAQPEVSIEYVNGTRRELESLLERGAIDLAVVTEIGETLDVASIALLKFPVVVGLGRGHRLHGAPTIDLTELSSDTLIVLDSPLGREYAHATLTPARIQPPLIKTSPNTEMAMAMVAAGLGYGLFFNEPLQRPLFDAMGIWLASANPAPPHAVAVVKWMTRTPLPPRIQCVLDACRDIAEPTPTTSPL